MPYYIYILSNDTDVAIYTGVTNDLARRVLEHKNHINVDSFTAQHNIHKLVYYEVFSEAKYAILREKQLKSWKRKRKNTLVTNFNPKWEDLYEQII